MSKKSQTTKKSSSGSSCTVLVALVVVVIGILAGISLQKRVDFPEHLLGHEALYVPELLSEDVAKDLMRMAKEEFGEFPQNTADTRFYKTLHEHIGEGQPLVNDTCAHSFLVPNTDRSLCILPGRIDIGRHFILAGGYVGLKEFYEVSLSRLLSFGRYLFNPADYPTVDKLFKQDEFQKAAKTVCPADKQTLDAFQFNFIVQVPGQTVALHVDAVYFWGATRFQFPQWLLAVMQFSGLFQEEFIDQVQVVGYFHEWNNTDARSGDFVYWKENKPEPLRIAPVARAGSVVDGSKVVHAASVYTTDKHSGVVDRPPLMDKSRDNTLKYVGNDKWTLQTDGQDRRTYDTDDLRWTVVYRARCFRDEAEIEKFHNLKEEEYMSLEFILQRLSQGLVDKGKVASVQEAMNMDRLDLSMLLMDSFIKYPLPPSALIPYNYCSLAKKWAWTRPLLAPICQ